MKKTSALILILTLTMLISSCTSGDVPSQGTDTETGANVSIDTVPLIILPPGSDTKADTTQPSDTSSGTASTDSETTAEITEAETEPEPPAVEYTYNTDVSKYLKYIDPEDRDGYLILVNRSNKLDEDYVPEDLTDLVDTRDDGRDTQQMVKTAAKALEAFLIEARDAGCEGISVTSGYRSYSRQNYLFGIYTNDAMDPDEIRRNYKTDEALDTLVKNLVSCLGVDEDDAENIAYKIRKKKALTKEEAILVTSIESCEGGTSEHQSGLCIDMHNLGSARPEFADEPEAKWLAENCHKFGFVVRFPENKTSVTKIVYEPWHFRFVGRYHAQRMKDLDMCLEEYTEYLNKE